MNNINVVGKKTARNGRKTTIYQSQILVINLYPSLTRINHVGCGTLCSKSEIILINAITIGYCKVRFRGNLGLVEGGNLDKIPLPT